MYKIIETTDNKFLGVSIDNKPIVGAKIANVIVEKVVEFGEYLQVSNSNYVILFKRVENDKY